MGDASDDSDPLWEGMGSSDRDGVLSSHEIEACVTTHRTRLQFAVARDIQHWTLQRLDVTHVELCQAATAYWNDIFVDEVNENDRRAIWLLTGHPCFPIRALCQQVIMTQLALHFRTLSCDA